MSNLLECSDCVRAIAVRDSILRPPVPQSIFICNIDICSTFPFAEMLDLHGKHRGTGTILGVNVSLGLTASGADA